jgi:predicted HAD superfamily Cof-like phosphohydrolase
MRISEAKKAGYSIQAARSPVATKSSGMPAFTCEPQGNFQDVQDFHDKFGIPRASQPTLLVGEALAFRIKFLEEEIREFKEAHEALEAGRITPDVALELAADALIDETYVAMGTADMMGLPWDKLWDEVHRANMEKVRATEASQSKRGSALDIIKPDGWVAPDHRPALGLAGV